MTSRVGMGGVRRSLGRVLLAATVALSVVAVVPDPAGAAGVVSIEFDLASQLVSEDDASVTIDVIATAAGGGDLDSNVGVTVSVLGSSTASNPDDHTYGGGTLSWLSTDGTGTVKTVTVPLAGDSLVEGRETIRLELSSPTGGAVLGSRTTHDVRLNDNDGLVVSFPRIDTTSVEGASPALNLVLDGDAATLGADLDVDVSVTGGTATGTDYSLGTTTATFTAGSGDGTTRAVSMTLSDDADHEPIETVEITLSVQSNGVDTVAEGTQAVHTYTINDNDDVSVDFGTAASGANEGSTPHTVAVTLTWTGGAALQDDVVVDIDDTPGTASTPGDYTLSTTQLTFPAGTTSGASQDVDVAIADDDSVESAQDFDLDLTVASGPAAGGATTSHTVTITDNDTAGITIDNPGGLDVTEGGTADSFDVVLTTQPSAEVDVEVTADAEVRVNGAATDTLTFTTSNWETPQPVDVTAVDDGYFEGAHSGTVSFTVTSADGDYDGFVLSTLTADVTDDDIVTISGPTLGNEGQLRAYSAIGFDPPGAGNSHGYQWSVTKGGALYFSATTQGFSFTPDDDETYEISLTITDADDDTGTDTATLIVANVDPDVTAGTITAVSEGGTATLSGFTYSDDGTADTHDGSINWGDGTTDLCPLDCTIGGGTIGGSHVYLDDDGDDTYTVRVTVVDDDGGSSFVDVPVTVTNVAPVVSAPTSAGLTEGDTLTSQISFTDPGIDTHEACIDYGEAGPACTFTTVSSPFSLDNLYEQDGSYTVTIVVRDSDGDESDPVTIDVTVANAAPVVTARDDVDALQGDTVFITGDGGTSFTDAGALDTHTATIDWDDGAGPETAGVDQDLDTIGFPGGHTYTTPGTYTVVVEVADGDGGVNSDTFTVNVQNLDFTVNAAPTPGTVIDEGDTISVAAAFEDTDGSGTYTATIDWGDGIVDDCSLGDCEVVGAGDGTGGVTGSHLYPQDGSFTVTVTVVDTTEIGDVGTDGFTVTVDNVLPTTNVDGPATSLEGEQIKIFGNPFDPGVEDVLSYAWEIRDPGGALIKTGTNKDVRTRTTDDGTHSAIYTVLDDAGIPVEETFNWIVENVAPIAVIIDAETGDPIVGITDIGVEGSTITLGATIDDPGTADTFTYDWEIVQPGSDPITGSDPTISFVSPDDGFFFVNLIVTDDDGGEATPDSPIINVTNGAPEIVNIVTDATPAVGATVNLNVFFDDPGTQDTHVVTIDWGDGDTDTVDPATSPAGATHSYPTAGPRSAEVCITDDNAGQTCASWYYNVGASLGRAADFDADGYEDLAVGVPGEDAGAGGVHIVYGTPSGPSGAGDQFLQQGSGGMIGLLESGDGFGSALAHGDFNGDGYTDLAIGAPGEDMAGLGDVGNVTVIYGSSTGLAPSTDELWHQNRSGVADANEVGDGWGQALAAGDFNGDAFADLAVGAPFENVGGVADAGRVTILFGSPGGLTAAGDVVLDQDVEAMRNVGQPNDHFGAALAAADFNGDGFADIAMGIPGQRIGTSDRAGAVSVVLGGLIRMDIAGNRFRHQDTGGVIGVAGGGDEFGRVLDAGDITGDGLADLAIGIPGERVGGKTNAGAVTVLPGSGVGPSPAGDAYFREGANGLNGVPANQDGFGSAIAVGDITGDGLADLLIGIPNQKVSGKKQAGLAAFIPGSANLGTTGNSRWHEDKNKIIGLSQIGDHLGAALTIADADGDGFGDLVLGIPDQNRQGRKDVGAVLYIRGRNGGPVKAGDVRLWQGRDGIRDQAQQFDRFGAAL